MIDNGIFVKHLLVNYMVKKHSVMAIVTSVSPRLLWITPLVFIARNSLQVFTDYYLDICLLTKCPLNMNSEEAIHITIYS